MWFDFLYKFVWNKSYSKKNWAKCNLKKCIGLHVKYPFFLSDLKETWIFSQIFEKYLNIKFHKILPVRAEFFRVERRTNGRTDGGTGMTKLMVAFCCFANVTKTYIPVLARNKQAYNPLYLIYQITVNTTILNGYS
jgi:hypothetical protein